MRIRPLFLVLLVFLASTAAKSAAEDHAPLTFDDLAGEYVFGDGTGQNCTLILQEPGMFSFVWVGCMGIYGQNSGKAVVAHNQLNLILDKPNTKDGFGGTPTSFFPIRWGARTYLVPPGEMAEFCSAINHGSEPRKAAHGMFYLRRDDWKKVARAQPALPEPFDRHLLEKPVRGKITRRIDKLEAWTDLGAKDGLVVGMILTASDRDKMLFTSVRVETVEPGRCRVRSLYKFDRSNWLAVGETVASSYAD